MSMSDQDVLAGAALVLLGLGQWPPRDPLLPVCRVARSESRDTMQDCPTSMSDQGVLAGTALVLLGLRQWPPRDLLLRRAACS